VDEKAVHSARIGCPSCGLPHEYRQPRIDHLCGGGGAAALALAQA
jgi:hypothetical protein